MPTLEQFEFWCLFQEAYEPEQFGKLVAAWWTTYHEFTM